MGSPDPGLSIDSHILVLFDGVCNLCNGAVQFIIRRDPKAKFLFASLQSQFASDQLVKFGISGVAMESIVVIYDGKAFQKSDAALKIAAQLHGLWRVLYIFRFIPRFIRDALYDFIAARRYKIFGRQDSCMIPDPSLKKRFVV
ncbi:MAG: thiol-disulfide oxidoreductase DCC family protein [Chryseolinea sp.]